MHRPVKPQRPASLTVVAVLVLVEALAVLAVSGFLWSQIAAPGPLGIPGRAFLALVVTGAAVWQAWVGLNVLRGRAWTRAAVVVWQVFQIILSAQAVQAAGGIAFVPLLVAALAVVLLFDPKATAFYGDRSNS